MVKKELDFKYIITIILIVSILVLIELNSAIKKAKYELKNSISYSIETNILQHAKSLNLQINKELTNSNTTLVNFLQKNPSKIDEYNKRLELIRSKDVPYVYILWFDGKNKFRFLCDGSQEKSNFFSKFDPGNLNLWKKIYKNKAFASIDQTKYEGLWKTFLYPIVFKNNTEAILVVDYSVELPSHINKTIEPFEKMISAIYISVIILSITILIQFLYLFIVGKRNYIDPLTKIHNRRYLEVLSKKIKLTNYNIAMIDLDHFKKINDTYGHQVGDDSLVYAVSIIKKHIGKKDILIRYGGEEFVLFVHVSNSIFKITEDIRKHLSTNPLQNSLYGSIYIKTSIGIVTKNRLKINMEHALKNADIALYEAKKSGRNCIVEAKESNINNNSSEYNFLEIKNLIDENKVECYFQPLYHNNTNKIAKYEILVRLRDKDGKLIMPASFLPIIWKTNVYNKMTKQVIEKGINILREKEENFSINLSLQDILDEKILSIIKEIAVKEPDSIKKMGIEILEYDRFENINRLKNIINQLKDLGISIILDDFGSGHANFSILERLDIDELKIDGMIVENINKNKKSFSLLKSLSVFAKQNNIKITAEYVSSKDIYDTIRKMDFDYLQGFYLGKPGPLSC
ncbi:EAL domain-containing protein [Sulfurospirillum sp. 1307]|jgi:diguanylate cyclase (GGDEF)-like protein